MSMQDAHAIVFLRGLGEAEWDTDIVREVILEFPGDKSQKKWAVQDSNL
ncbi:MAG: hypothetical protein MUQ10_09400 [Anaerolineae bacterium]|nr:hypothetical protein [Anaerolineae bacterium]